MSEKSRTAGIEKKRPETESEILAEIINSLPDIKGKLGFYYANLVNGTKVSYQAELPLHAASVIKIPVMISCFLAFARGELSPGERHILKEEEKLPSCGALNRMEAGLSLSVMDLINLMIILSDNTATNILIRRLSMEQINYDLEALGYSACRMNRLLFDAEASARGLENTVGAAEIADMLGKMYRGELISREASQNMLEILQNQRLNGKIPAGFEEKTLIAHKTGEDSGISHDVGIVGEQHPFIICFLGNELEHVPAWNRFMAEKSWELYQALK
ncbi:MAG: serine hydrolase [Eubacteriales bacterium]|nr:serine hydrolase [Eubacteriales bacterium]